MEFVCLLDNLFEEWARWAPIYWVAVCMVCVVHRCVVAVYTSCTANLESDSRGSLSPRRRSFYTAKNEKLNQILHAALYFVLLSTIQPFIKHLCKNCDLVLQLLIFSVSSFSRFHVSGGSHTVPQNATRPPSLPGPGLRTPSPSRVARQVHLELQIGSARGGVFPFLCLRPAPA